MEQDPSSIGESIECAIVGMAGRFPGAKNVSEFWDNIASGLESFTLVSDEDDPRFSGHPHYVNKARVLDNISGFDFSFFGVSPKEAAIMDPQHRLFLEVSYEAMENARLDGKNHEHAVGVFAGCGHQQYFYEHVLGDKNLLAKEGFFSLRHASNDKDFLATRTSYTFDLRGPSINVATACSTSLVAVHMACQSLVSGESDVALAGGCTIELPHGQGYVYREGEVLSPDGHCRTFDKDAAGTVFGSGCGVVVLKTLSDAMETGDEILAVIKGSAINNDGREKVSYLAPSVTGQANVISEALSVADVDASSIGYVETHGTGTKLGDPIEVEALKQAYGPYDCKAGACAIGSVKPNVGHLDTASGVCGLIKAVYALREKKIPPSIGFKELNPSITLKGSPFYVNTVLKDWQVGENGVRRAGVTSLGVGGTNAHVILEEAKKPAARAATLPLEGYHIIPLSAHCQGALTQMGRDLARLCGDSRALLEDISYTRLFGRRVFSEKKAILAGDKEEFCRVIEEDDHRYMVGGGSGGFDGKVFLFTGSGFSFCGMGKSLYDKYEVYRRALKDCSDILKEIGDFDLISLLYPESVTQKVQEEFNRPSRNMPLVVAAEWAMFRLLDSFSIRAQYLMGHSTGEIACAVCAGIWSLEDGLKIAYQRGLLFEKMEKGRMTTVRAEKEKWVSLMESGLSIAAYNGPLAYTVSGSCQAIARFEAKLRERNLFFKSAQIDVASHSALVEPIMAEFRDFLSGFEFSKPSIDIVSNLTGDLEGAKGMTSPEYWVRHLREPVRFHSGVLSLEDQGAKVYIELGAGKILSTLCEGIFKEGSRSIALPSFGSYRETLDDDLIFKRLVGKLWILGDKEPIEALYEGKGHGFISLPNYPFQRSKRWIDKPKNSGVLAEEKARESLLAPMWVKLPSGGLPSHMSKAQGGVKSLIVTYGCEVGDLLASYLRRGGEEVKVFGVCGFGGKRDFSCDFEITAPFEKGRLGKIFSSLDFAATDRVRVYFFAPHVERDDSELGEVFTKLLASNISLPIQFAKVLSQVTLAAKNMVFVSNSCFRVSFEDVESPFDALLAGPARVLESEFSDLVVHHLDMDFREIEDASLAILDELGHGKRETDVRWRHLCLRNKQLYYQDFQRPHVVPKTLYKEKGSYLITGGLGGIGYYIGIRLLEEYGAKVYLVTRSKNASLDSGHKDKNKNLLAAQKRPEYGKSLHIIEADVTDIASVKAHLAPLFSRLDGVIHSAGVLKDQLAAAHDVQVARSVLSPKMLGTGNLLAVLEGHALDFFICFSSVSVFTGIEGQIDYVAANCLSEALMQRASGKTKTPLFTVFFGPWADVGMASRLKEAPPCGILWEEKGQGVFESQVCEGSSWVLSEHVTKKGQSILPGTGYISLVYNLLRSYRPLDGGFYELKEARFLSPCFLSAMPKALRVKIKDGSIAFESEDKESGRVLHAYMSFSVSKEKKDVKHDISAFSLLRETAGEEVFDHPFLAFGERWDVVRRSRYGASEALIDLRLDGRFREDLSSFPLHPALLDMAVGGGQALIGEDGLFVPESYGVIKIYRELTASCQSHIVLTRKDGEGKRCYFDVTITDSHRNVLVSVEDFIMRGVDKEKLGAFLENPHAKKAIELKPKEAWGHLKKLSFPNERLIISHLDPRDAAKRAGKEATRLEEARKVKRPSLATPFSAPLGEYELLVAKHWEEALFMEGIGRKDHFFELGGHSLLLTQTATRVIQSAHVSPSLASFFEEPTIENWALLLSRSRKEAVSSEVLRIEPAKRKAIKEFSKESGSKLGSGIEEVLSLYEKEDTILAVTASQKQIYYLQMSLTDSRAYNIPLCYRVEGELSLEAFRRAYEGLVCKHEILRSNYVYLGGKVHQVMRQKPLSSLEFDECDFKGEDEQASYIKKQIEVDFDLARDSLIQCRVSLHKDGFYLVFFNFHHIIVDHTAIEQFARELHEGYSYFLNGEGESEGDASLFEASCLQFGDYALYKESASFGGATEKDLGFWTSHLEGRDTLLDLPTDHKRPRVQRYRGEELKVDFGGELSFKLRSFCREKSQSLYVTALSVFKLLLSRYSNQKSVIVGTPFGNRLHDETQDMLGCFINTLPIATTIEKEQSFDDILLQTKKAINQVYAHQHVPFEEIVSRVDIAKSASHNPLFQVGFTVQGEPMVLKLEGANSKLLPVHNGGSKFDLMLWLWDNGQNIQGAFEYDSDLFEKETVKALFASYLTLVRGCIADSKVKVLDYPLLEDGVKASFVQNTSSHYEAKKEKTILAGFKRVAQKAALKTAITDWQKETSYGALADEVNRAAYFLRQNGIEKGDRVAVCLTRSSKMVSTLLGIWQVGASYVPMDPMFPLERLRYMMEDSEAAAIVTESSLMETAGKVCREPSRVLRVEEIEGEKVEDGFLLEDLDPKKEAYIIYTSGSTGLPKGVRVSHLNAFNFISSMEFEPGIKESDRLLAVTTLSFDISILEIFLPLSTGAHLVLCDSDTVKSADSLMKAIFDHDITLMQATPATWQSLVSMGFEGKDNLRVLCGGEAFPKNLADSLRKENKEVWNMYGPTETTVWSSISSLQDDGDITIGAPIDNTSISILDAKNRAVPFGVKGEIAIGGLGVSLGYHGRDDLTERVFVKNPQDGSILYKTGDIGRMLRSGAIEIFGREDGQVKVRGFRIELGDIEGALLSSKEVELAACKVHEENGHKVIVGYIKAHKKSGEDSEELREVLREGLKLKLPYYMIPQHFVFLDEMPKTDNGKVDRGKLEFKKKTLESCDFMVDSLTKALKEFDFVLDAACYQHYLPNGSEKVVAYVVPKASVAMPSVTSLRGALEDRCKDQRLPSQFVFLSKIAKSGSGKVILANLPNPYKVSSGGRLTKAEQELAGIFMDILQVDEINASDSFFDLGGHSLLSIELSQKIESHFHKKVRLMDLQVQSLAKIASNLSQGKSSVDFLPR